MGIIWDEVARAAFRAHVRYIARDSPQSAERVRVAIIEKTLSIPKYPFSHRADERKLNNDGTYRVFTHLRCRVSYRVLKAQDVIHIVRFRHTSQQPEFY